MRRFLLFLSLALLISCHKEQDLYFSISNKSLFVYGEAPQATTNITANCEWTISNIPRWLEVGPQNGNSNAQIRISIIEGIEPSEISNASLWVTTKTGSDIISLVYYPKGTVPEVSPKDDNFRKYKKDLLNDEDDNVAFVGRADTYQQSKHADPVNIVILGDGFIAEENVAGGYFSSLAKEATEGIFSITPYSTYRDYFTVTFIAVNSPERGATVGNQSPVNTLFQTEIEGGNSTAISCNYSRVFNAVRKFTSFDESTVENTMIVLIINKNIYAGTCVMYSTGESIAMCPTDRSSEKSFVKIVLHEAGGHGFGKLADEYVYYSSQNVPRNEVNTYTQWMNMGGVNSFYQNISFTNNPTQVGWSTFIGRSNYEKVGTYEGAISYGLGVWRCEPISCMEDNRLYFNVASRYAIYKRIMTIAKVNYSVSDFVVNDFVTSDPTPAKGTTRNTDGVLFRPLAPPVLVKN